MVLEEDGCELPREVLEDVFKTEEKVGVIMFLSPGESWTGSITLLSSDVYSPKLGNIAYVPKACRQYSPTKGNKRHYRLMTPVTICSVTTLMEMNTE